MPDMHQITSGFQHEKSFGQVRSVQDIQKTFKKQRPFSAYSIKSRPPNYMALCQNRGCIPQSKLAKDNKNRQTWQTCATIRRGIVKFQAFLETPSQTNLSGSRQLRECSKRDKISSKQTRGQDAGQICLRVSFGSRSQSVPHTWIKGDFQ